MIFQRGKSYLWLFGVLAIPFVAVVFSVTSRSVIVVAAVLLSAFTTFLFVSEIRSGVALDNFWRAVYEADSQEYLSAVTAHGILATVFILFTCFIAML